MMTESMLLYAKFNLNLTQSHTTNYIFSSVFELIIKFLFVFKSLNLTYLRLTFYLSIEKFYYIGLSLMFYMKVYILLKNAT